MAKYRGYGPVGNWCVILTSAFGWGILGAFIGGIACGILSAVVMGGLCYFDLNKMVDDGQ